MKMAINQLVASNLNSRQEELRKQQIYQIQLMIKWLQMLFKL